MYSTVGGRQSMRTIRSHISNLIRSAADPSISLGGKVLERTTIREGGKWDRTGGVWWWHLMAGVLVGSLVST